MKYLFSIMLFCLAYMSSAQFSTSISAGPTFSKVVHDDFERETLFKTGYFIAVTPGYRISDFVSINLSAQYSNETFSDDPDGLIGGFDYKINYVDLIPEVELHLIDFISLGVGLNYGIKLNEYTRSNDDWNKGDDDVSLFKNSDVAITGKLQAYFQNLFAYARYNHGLTNISETVQTDTNGDPISGEQRSRGFQVGVGYKIVFGD